MATATKKEIKRVVYVLELEEGEMRAVRDSLRAHIEKWGLAEDGSASRTLSAVTGALA